VAPSPPISIASNEEQQQQQLAPRVNAAGPASLSMQVADCRTKIKELHAWKDQRLQNEDYLGAHHVKELIKEQEGKLRTLQQQLDASGPSKRTCTASGVTVTGVAANSEGENGGGNEVAVDVDMLEKESVDEDSAENDADAGPWRCIEKDGGLVELRKDSSVVAASRFPFRLARDTFERLYPYQRVGVAWMARLWQQGQGGILADEMGLGKTVQVCAFIHGARKAGATHALFLLPVTLLDHWAKEARAWCPGWPVYTYHGTEAQRRKALRRVSRPSGGILLASYGVLSSSDKLFDVAIDDPPSPARRGRPCGRPGGGSSKRRRLDDDDFDADAGLDSGGEELREPEIPPGELPAEGKKIAWNVVVCDEAHRMKGISTLLGKSVRQIKAECRLLLSGTPVQNALQDLWALMDFAQPGLLGNHATFVKHFSDPIDKGSVRGAPAFAVQLKKHLAEQLRSRIGPHILRRTKVGAGLIVTDDSEDVGAGEERTADEEAACDAKQLPPKRETVVWLAPSDEQKHAYGKILESSDIIREACSKSKLGVEVFRAIGLLKRLCNHPVIALPGTKAGDWSNLLSECRQSAESIGSSGEVTVPMSTSSGISPSKIAPVLPTSEEDRDETNEAMSLTAQVEEDDAEASVEADVETLLRQLPRSFEAIVGQSAKLKCLASMLPALADRGHRVLVFSQSVKMLDLVWLCCLKPKGLRCLRLDGQTDSQERAAKVAKFQAPGQLRFQFMLLTTSVGGVGLNLTAADRVVVVDPAWNPATDSQAVDRAYRIGQEKEVRVYRLIMSGLIEDKMFRLQIFKMGLTKTALEADQQHRYFTAREIRTLFEWTDPNEGETRKLIEQAVDADENAAKCQDERETILQEDADEDGANGSHGNDGWLQAGSAVGMSDFAQIFSVSQEDEEPDAVCAAQITEAKHKLGAADEKMQRMIDEKSAAISEHECLLKKLEETNANVDLLKEKRMKTEEVVRSYQKELKLARAAESDAQKSLDKATRVWTSAQEQLTELKFETQTAKEAAETENENAKLTVSDACEDAFSRAHADAELQLSIVDERGKACGGGIVDAEKSKLKQAQKARDKLRAALAAAATRQTELRSSEEDLLRVDNAVAEAEATAKANHLGENGDSDTSATTDLQAILQKKELELAIKSRERERQKAATAHTAAQGKAESSREAVAQAIQAFIEAAVEFTDSFTASGSQTRRILQPEVKGKQTSVKAIFRQLPSSWISVKKFRSASLKQFVVRRSKQQKLILAADAEGDAEILLANAERDLAKASAEDGVRRQDRSRREEELDAAERARAEVETEEVEIKRQRDELKKAIPRAKEAIKLAKQNEKEAGTKRQELHNDCVKVERQASAVEQAKNSAMETLEMEEYDANQVDKAYDKANKARGEA
jgi:SNF2 family DNA or RNA helicase